MTPAAMIKPGDTSNPSCSCNPYRVIARGGRDEPPTSCWKKNGRPEAVEDAVDAVDDERRQEGDEATGASPPSSTEIAAAIPDHAIVATQRLYGWAPT